MFPIDIDFSRIKEVLTYDPQAPMIFSSGIFLWLFTAFLVVYVLLQHKHTARILFVTLFSYYFYYKSSGTYFFLLALVTVCDFFLAQLMARAEGYWKRKGLVVLSLSVNLGLLAYFKYTNFILQTLRLPKVSVLPAPVGVSFLTFLLISYLADVYRGRIPAETRFSRFFLYALYFPKAAQGPLCRYGDFSAQLDGCTQDAALPDEGVSRLILGLGKKVLLSGAAGAVAKDAFGLPAASLTPVYAWAGAICYAMQLYFDFSGYTDMALGLSLCFGIRLPENFNSPYLAVSVTDFWRRWHISLSGWFRDYVYIPLGGSRCSRARQVLNLFAVWSLTGIWHGANWTFLAWGLWFFVLLTAEKLWLGKALSRLPRVFGHVYALLAVLIGWIFFNSRSLPDALGFLRALVVPGTGAPDGGAWLLLCLKQYGLQLAVCFVLCTDLGKKLWQTLGGARAGRALRYAVLALVFFLSVLTLTGSGMQAFIYARF